MIRIALVVLSLFAFAACGGGDSSADPQESADGWCCIGTWEECSAETPIEEGLCLGGLPCGDGAGVACRTPDAQSICVWGEEVTLGDGTSCVGIHGRRVNESGEWEAFSYCHHLPITESDCIR